MSVTRRTYPSRRLDEATGNDLVDQLGATMRAAVLKHGDTVRLEFGTQVLVPGKPIKHVIFPINAVCSLSLGLPSGQYAGTSTVGSEGMVGISAILGTAPTERALVQIPGDALLVSVGILCYHMERNLPARQVFRRYIAYSFDMAKQNSVCNAYHSIDERVARWLLTTADRTREDALPCTQDLLSQMVAASRPRVSEALARLKCDRLIEYGRGFVRILDRAGVEKRSCECYAAMKDWQTRFA